MQEFAGIRQDAGSFKRYFFDQDFDLYVWYDHRGGEVTGFQLIYDKQTTPRAITWMKDKGIRHNLVDGYDSYYWNISPILVPDGSFDAGRVAQAFLTHSSGVEKDLVVLVQDVLLGYNPRNDDQLV